MKVVRIFTKKNTSEAENLKAQRKISDTIKDAFNVAKVIASSGKPQFTGRGSLRVTYGLVI